jgi:hypothetical protein
VINRKNVERYSMVIAWDPNFETLVDPVAVFPESESVKYAPVQCGDYVLSDLMLPLAIEKQHSHHE